MKDPPQYQPPPPDPLFTALQTQAQQTQINAIQQQTKGDTASLMARYGAMVAITGAAPSLALGTPASGATQMPFGVASNLMAGAPIGASLAKAA